VRLRAATLFALVGSQAMALAPLPPCDGVAEAGMQIGDIQVLGGDAAESGVTVERYGNSIDLQDNVYVSRPGPVPALNEFHGVRVTSCSTGDFLAIPQVEVDTVNGSLAATEFLRASVQSSRRVTFGAVRQAAKAVYGKVIVLRETEETCSCSVYFPDLKPARMTAFEDRTDVEP